MSTTLPGILVVGQRREAGSAAPFPSRGGDSPPDQEMPGAEKPIVEDGGDPCSVPETALPWNADAAGSGAVPKFLAKAAELGFADAPGGTPNLLNREFGAYLIRGSVRSVTSGPVTAGPPRNQTDPNAVSEITIDTAGVTPTNYQGDIHSHPNGNPLPSQADWDNFMSINNAARSAGRVNETFYMYVVVVDQNGGPPTIRVYQDGPRAANSPNPPRPTTEGPEVNPDAQPCN